MLMAQEAKHAAEYPAGISWTGHGYSTRETRQLDGRYKPADFSNANWDTIARVLVKDFQKTGKAPEELQPAIWASALKHLFDVANEEGKWVGLVPQDFVPAGKPEVISALLEKKSREQLKGLIATLERKDASGERQREIYEALEKRTPQWRS